MDHPPKRKHIFCLVLDFQGIQIHWMYSVAGNISADLAVVSWTLTQRTRAGAEVVWNGPQVDACVERCWRTPVILCDLPCSNSEIHSCFGKFACKRLVLVLTRAEKNRRSVCCHANSHEPEVNNMFMLDEFCHMSIADWQKGGKNNAKDFEAATEAEAEALLHRVEIGAVSPQPVFSARVMQYHTPYMSQNLFKHCNQIWNRPAIDLG